MKTAITILTLCAAAGSAMAQFTAPMPAQTSTFTGSTRGFVFTAPVDFKITGVKVLNATGNTNAFQNFSVVRHAALPPLFSAVTNDFVTLHTALAAASGSFVAVDIDVHAGDIIGMYGNTTVGATGTSGLNSYANAPGGNNTNIFGNTVPLLRSGMQFHLGNGAQTAMRDVWREGTSNTSNITRIEFQYDVIPAPGAASLLALAGIAAARRRR